MAPVPKKATYEDLMAVPENLVAEILDGELVTSPRPTIPHAQSSSQMLADLLEDLVRAEPFDAAELELARWWIDSA